MSYATQGFGAAEDCRSNEEWDETDQSCYCKSDDAIIDSNGNCADPSTLCGPGTQWVDADKACVSLTRYMSTAQQAAATKAGVNITGAVQTIPVVVTVKKPTTPAPVVPSPFARLASLLGGGATPWVVGGLVVGLTGLALMSRSSDSSDYRRADYR